MQFITIKFLVYSVTTLLGYIISYTVFGVISSYVIHRYSKFEIKK